MKNYSKSRRDLVSIVVPVYNVEKYLDRCIESLIAQTYVNLEIILVDDGATDGSLLICKKYEKLDERVKVYHKENGGLSSARNYGIEKAAGMFISFVDSDDYVDPKYIDVLMENATYNSISIVNHKKVFENTCQNEENISKMAYEVMNKKEVLKLFLLDNNYVSAWGKLYPLSFFESVRFPEGRIYEDFATIYKVYDMASEIYVYNVSLYNYLMRQNSITKQSFSERTLDMIPACDEVEKFIIDNQYFDLESVFIDKKVRNYLTLYHKIKSSSNGKNYCTVSKEIEKYLYSLGGEIFLNKEIMYKTKVALLLYWISPKLFVLFFEMKKLGG